MSYSSLISTQELAKQLTNPQLAVIDCRFSLAEPDLGRSDYLQHHVPDAIYAHLEQDLSGPIILGKTGRHPLPTQQVLTDRFSEWGIERDTQVVVYDDSGGSMAARLWWMFQWQGHPLCAVLDGGWQAWEAQGLPTRSSIEPRTPGKFTPRPNPQWLVTTQQVEEIRTDQASILVDLRAPERFRGELEPIDPVAGHIPGAINAFYADTLDSEGFYLPRERLLEHFQKILMDRPPQEAVFYCGSGVSASQNILAMAAAGLNGAKLYVGSWSEWINDASRPIETGSGEAMKRQN